MTDAGPAIANCDTRERGGRTRAACRRRPTDEDVVANHATDRPRREAAVRSARGLPGAVGEIRTGRKRMNRRKRKVESHGRREAGSVEGVCGGSPTVSPARIVFSWMRGQTKCARAIGHSSS